MDDIHFEVVQAGATSLSAPSGTTARAARMAVVNRFTRRYNENHSNVRFTVQVPRSVRVGRHSVTARSRCVTSALRSEPRPNGTVRVLNAAGPVWAHCQWWRRCDHVGGSCTAENSERKRRCADGVATSDDDMTFKREWLSLDLRSRGLAGKFRFDTPCTAGSTATSR